MIFFRPQVENRGTLSYKIEHDEQNHSHLKPIDYEKNEKATA
jgi:hypothetical protein